MTHAIRTLFLLLILAAVAHAQERLVGIQCGPNRYLFWENGRLDANVHKPNERGAQWVMRSGGDGTFSLEPRGSGLQLLVEGGTLKVGTASRTGNNAWRQMGAGSPYALYNVDGRTYVTADNSGYLFLTSMQAPLWSIVDAPVATRADAPQPVLAVRWKSLRQPAYLHFQFGAPEASDIDPAWKATEWVMQPLPGGAFRLENVGNGKFLVVQNGRIAMGDRDPDEQGRGNDVWTKDGHAGEIQLKHQQTGLYLTLGPANPGAQFGRRSVMLVPAPDANSSWREEDVIVTAATPRPAAARPSRDRPSEVRSVSDVFGTYRFEPYANQSHQGTIAPDGPNTFVWRNQAGDSWRLTPGGPAPFTVLNTDTGKTFDIQRDGAGKVTGFKFQGDLYRRL